jgi:hypothetical protein
MLAEPPISGALMTPVLGVMTAMLLEDGSRKTLSKPQPFQLMIPGAVVVISAPPERASFGATVEPHVTVT